MMKSTLLFLLVAGSYTMSRAQIPLPAFVSNAVAIDTVHYRELIAITATGELSLSLMHDSYDSHCSTYELLTYRNGRWTHYTYRNNYRDDNQDPIANKSSLQEQPISSRKCNRAWKQLLDHQLLSMSADAQKKTEKVWPGNKIERFNISHGDHYEFVIRTPDKMRVVYSYSPDKFYEWMPELPDRKYFIDCRDIFLKLVD